MIIKKDGSFQTRSDMPNTNWYEGEDNFIIDETTEQGQLLAEKYINNYPLVTFEVDGENVVSVDVIELEKPIEVEGKEIELIQNEQGVWEYIYVDIPLTKEQVMEAQIAQQDSVIEEILFDIIPNLLGGMGGE